MVKPREDPNPEVKKVRTEHGTRVARAIVCTECGAKDTVHFAPRDESRVLCRKCAAQLLGVSDRDAGIRPEREHECCECGRREVAAWRGEDPFVCSDCRCGILSHQQNRTKKAERVGEGRVLRVRRSAPKDD